MISAYEQLEDLDRVERCLNVPLEHPRLQSLTEAVRICPGFQNQGCINANAISSGDEPEEGSDICAADIREEERFYQREMWAEDGHEELIPYEYLTDKE